MNRPTTAGNAALRRRASLLALSSLLEALRVRQKYDPEKMLARSQRRLAAQRGWALRKGEYEQYLAHFGSHERPDVFWRIADRIEDAATYWRCLRDVWAGDDAPGVRGYQWRALWTGRPGHEMAMLPAEIAALVALPDLVRIYRGTREARAGMSWTTDPSTAAWFAR